MVATGTKFVLPKSPKWCALLVCVGVFGLAAQVCKPQQLATVFMHKMTDSLLAPLADPLGARITTREGRAGSVSNVLADRVRVRVPIGVPAHAHHAS